MNIVELLNDTSAELRQRIEQEPIPPTPGSETSPLRPRRPSPSWLIGLAAFILVTSGGAVLSILVWTPQPSDGPTSTPTQTPSSSVSQPTATTSETGLTASSFDTGPLKPRDGHSVVWTGSELIAWGGASSEASQVAYADGAAYDPAADTWRMLPEAPIPPRQGHHAAWTGGEMLIVGGLGHTDGAAYNPATDTWRLLPPTPVPTTSPAPMISQYTSSVWTGNDFVIWNVASDIVAAYSPEADSWRSLPPVELGAAAGVLRWDGESIHAFGIEAFDPNVNQLLFARLDAEEWRRLPDLTIAAPVPMLTAWTGEEFIAWNDEGRSFTYAPGQDSWVTGAPIPIAGCEGVGEPLETDEFLLVFGWCGDEALFDIAKREWVSLQLPGLGRGSHTVWTGTEILLWGDAYGDQNDPTAVLAWRLSPMD